MYNFEVTIAGNRHGGISGWRGRVAADNAIQALAIAVTRAGIMPVNILDVEVNLYDG